VVLRTEFLVTRSIRLISILASVSFATFTIAPFSQAFAANTPKPEPHFQKVMIVVLENADLQEALKQPGFAEFARHGALLNRFYAETHPSQPNYIALISGDTQNARTLLPTAKPDSFINPSHRSKR
jgi:hypothetical protein